MTEFTLDRPIETKIRDCSFFVRGYVTAMFFTNDEEWSVNDLSDKAINQISEDCQIFCQDQKTQEFIEEDEEQAGSDFWFTRNRHGAGFWDGDWSEEAGKYLTDRAHNFPEISPYMGDDGFIYLG